MFAIIAVVFLLILFFSNYNKASGTPALPEDFAGHWLGIARNDPGFGYLNRDTLHFEVTISRDNNITGWIGDAEIINGSVEKTSFWKRHTTAYNHQAALTLKGALIRKTYATCPTGLLLFPKNFPNYPYLAFRTTPERGSDQVRLKVSRILVEKQ